MDDDALLFKRHHIKPWMSSSVESLSFEELEECLRHRGRSRFRKRSIIQGIHGMCFRLFLFLFLCYLYLLKMGQINVWVSDAEIKIYSCLHKAYGIYIDYSRNGIL